MLIKRTVEEQKNFNLEKKLFILRDRNEDIKTLLFLNKIKMVDIQRNTNLSKSTILKFCNSCEWEKLTVENYFLIVNYILSELKDSNISDVDFYKEYFLKQVLK